MLPKKLRMGVTSVVWHENQMYYKKKVKKGLVLGFNMLVRNLREKLLLILKVYSSEL